MFQHTARRPQGTFIVSWDDGREEVYDSLCCVHCRHHWRVKPGSGRRRGWCFKCGGPTCGARGCDTCVPYEALLEAEEKAYARLAHSVLGNFVPGASGLLVPKL